MTELDTLDGRVLRPSEDGYDKLVSGYNRIVQHAPQIVVEAASADDVSKAVRYARSSRLGVGVLCTGHGPSRPANGVLINTHRLKGLFINAHASTATVQAGVLSGELVAAAADHGLAPLNGSSPGVGVVGYTLGGGVALLGRLHGWASDRVRRIEVVMADGSQRSLTRHSIGEDAELFWCMLGTRDNLGIVTELEIDLVPLEQVNGGGLWWTGDRVADALRAYVAWTRTTPNHFGSSLLVMQLPDLATIPTAIRGKFVAHVRLLHVGEEGEASRLIAPLRAVPGLAQDTFASIPYREVGTIHSDPSGPTKFEASNTLLGELDDAAIEELIKALHPDMGFLVELRHLGGRLSEATSQSVAGRRDGLYSLYAGTSLTNEPREDAAARQAELHRSMSAWGIGGPSHSFLSGPAVTFDELANAYYPDDLSRIVTLKERLDPYDVFNVHTPLRTTTEG